MFPDYAVTFAQSVPSELLPALSEAVQAVRHKSA